MPDALLTSPAGPPPAHDTRQDGPTRPSGPPTTDDPTVDASIPAGDARTGQLDQADVTPQGDRRTGRYGRSTDDAPAEGFASGPETGVRDAGTPRPGLQERIEAHPAGRALVVAVIALVLVTLAVHNLPDSALRERLVGSVAAVERHTGLAQDWKLFAPDPSPVGVALVAEVRRVDGTTGTWEPPVGRGTPLSAYRGYRWRKWSSALARTEEPLVLAAAAREVAARDEGAPTVEVTFYRVGIGEHAPLEPRFLGRVDVDEPGHAPTPTEQAGAGS